MCVRVCVCVPDKIVGTPRQLPYLKAWGRSARLCVYVHVCVCLCVCVCANKRDNEIQNCTASNACYGPSDS